MSHKLLKTSLVCLLASSAAYAGTDFSLNTLPTFKQGALTLTPGKTFFRFMKDDLGPKMLGEQQKANDDTLVTQGLGVGVKLNDSNYNIHVNYFDSAQSGRSYGWSKQKTNDSNADENGETGLVGDWSDRVYLQNLAKVVEGSDTDLTNFYMTMLQMLGNSDASGLSKLTGMPERVATNFLAIYGAEQFRAQFPKNSVKNWDDALANVTFLGAFHGGQSTMTMYYLKNFTAKTQVQKPGVFNERGKPAVVGTPKAADMTDYWQYTAIPTKTVSGINETRTDFLKMGEMITAYEKTVVHSRLIEAIEGVVKGDGKNVLEDTTQYFATGTATPDATPALTENVVKFLLEIHHNADAITTWISSQSGDATPTAPDQPTKTVHHRTGGTDQIDP